MRKILFRGETEQGEWLYGYLVKGNYDTGFGIIEDHVDKGLQYVKEETVGQYTGLTDKNGKKIFEGDICRVAYLGRRCDSNGKHYPVENVMIEEVVFEKGAFCFKTTIEYITIYRPIGFDIHGKPKTKYYEVIGNIHDNPELLEV